MRAHRAVVSIMAKGCIVACIILPLRCFLFSLPNYTNILVYLFYLRWYYLVMSLKYSFLNTPKQQYHIMLLTSGG